MPVRSACIARSLSTTGSEIVIYTCPAGNTVLIKDVRVAAPVASVSRAAVAVRSGLVQTSLIDTNLGLGLAAVSSGFVVLEPGDDIRIYSLGSVISVWVSGAILDGVA